MHSTTANMMNAVQGRNIQDDDVDNDNNDDVDEDDEDDADEDEGIDGRIRNGSKLHDSYTTQQLYFNFVPG